MGMMKGANEIVDRVTIMDESNAKILDPPLLVAKAIGTSVVLKDKQNN